MNVAKLVLLSLTLPLLTSVAFSSQEQLMWPELTKEERKAIEKEIEDYYQLKRKGWGPIRVRISAPSVVLSIQADGFRCQTRNDGTMFPTIVQDGRVVEVANKGGYFEAGYYKNLPIGTRVFVTEVDVEQEHVLFYLRKVDAIDGQVNGTTTMIDCMGSVEVPYGDTRSAAGILASLSPVLLTEAEAEALPPKTVSLGQSPGEVEANFGKPKQVIDLGPKKIYVYDSLKVIFMDGQVSDVQ